MSPWHSERSRDGGVDEARAVTHGAAVAFEADGYDAAAFFLGDYSALRRDFGVADYREVDPLFGTTRDAEHLVEQALTAADAAQVRALHVELDDDPTIEVVYHVLLPMADAAAAVEASLGVIERAIANLNMKLLEESLIVALVCIVFLFHARSALVAILTLPVGILMAFGAMRMPYGIGPPPSAPASRSRSSSALSGRSIRPFMASAICPRSGVFGEIREMST